MKIRLLVTFREIRKIRERERPTSRSLSRGNILIFNWCDVWIGVSTLESNLAVFGYIPRADISVKFFCWDHKGHS